MKVANSAEHEFEAGPHQELENVCVDVGYQGYVMEAMLVRHAGEGPL